MNPVVDMEVTSIPFGGGVWIRWITPDDADFHHVRILRKITPTFTGPDDPDAVLILDGRGAARTDYRAIANPDPEFPTDRIREVLDVEGLQPNASYSYAIYASNDDGTDVSDATVMSLITPDSGILSEPDLIAILLVYLKEGLARLTVKKTLKVRDGSVIDVVEAPARKDKISDPNVTIRLDHDAASDYTLGDHVDTRDFTLNTVRHSRGYISVIKLSVIGWVANNPETRRHLYRALKGLLIAARGVLEECGVENIEISGTYQEDFETYGEPMYMAVFTVTGHVVSRVDVDHSAVIQDIEVSPPTMVQTALC